MLMAAPMIINADIANDPLVSKLSNMKIFKTIISQSTQKSSLLFPSLKSSCLLLKVDSPAPEIQQKHLSQCSQFLRLNTNPFILLASTPGGDGSDVLLAANSLAVALEDQTLDKVQAVIPVLDEDIAIKTILYLVNSSKSSAEKVTEITRSYKEN